MLSSPILLRQSARVRKNQEKDDARNEQFLREEKAIRVVHSSNEGGSITILQLRFQSLDSPQPDAQFYVEEEMWLDAHNQRNPYLYSAISSKSIRNGLENFEKQFPHFHTIQRKLLRLQPIGKFKNNALAKELNQLLLLCTVSNAYISREIAHETTFYIWHSKKQRNLKISYLFHPPTASTQPITKLWFLRVRNSSHVFETHFHR